MNTIDPIAAHLHEITQELGTTNRRIVQRNAKGEIDGILDVPTNVPKLVKAGIARMDAAWSYHPDSVDALGRFQQLDAMKSFCEAAIPHVSAETAAALSRRARQVTNAIACHYDTDQSTTDRVVLLFPEATA